MLEEIKQLIKSEAEEDDWKYHIIPVVNYAKKLAQALNADSEIVEIAAWLHDIGRIRFGIENHELTGQPEAEQILQKYDYPLETIGIIKYCIETHRALGDRLPQTIIAKIIANADVMAHFDILPLFFYWEAKEPSFAKVYRMVDEKIEHDWTAKLTLPTAKTMMEEKYKAIRLLLDSTKQYM